MCYPGGDGTLLPQRVKFAPPDKPRKSQKNMKPRLSIFSALLLTGFAISPASAATVSYLFTGGSVTPTVTGLPAGVTASNFSIGSFPSGALTSDALLLTSGDVGTTSTGTSTSNNTVLSFSLTIPSDVTLSLTSLTYDYTTSGITGGEYFYARLFSSIQGSDSAVNDTITFFGKTSSDPASATGVTVNLENPTLNSSVGSNVTATDFTDLTNQTVTFSMPMLSNAATADSMQFDNITLNIAPVPEPSTALLCALGLIALLRRRR
jgi:hypothetical protein